MTIAELIDYLQQFDRPEEVRVFNTSLEAQDSPWEGDFIILEGIEAVAQREGEE